jgi:hypothetical protein
MGTRATYRVKEVHPYGNFTQCFYIHYDGYPEGAVAYFKTLLTNFSYLKESTPLGAESLSWRRGKAIAAFAMLAYCEFTEGHEEHGDTEYLYNLMYIHRDNKWFISATKVNRWNEDGFFKTLEFFDGELNEFIEFYSQSKAANQHA